MPSEPDPSLRFPSGTCQGFGPAWQKIGASWKPTGVSLAGPCITPLHFKNGTRKIVVHPQDPNDPDFVALAKEFQTEFKAAEKVDGLSADDTAALLSKFGDEHVVRGSIQPLVFAIHLVPRETMREGLDITPSLSPQLKAAIFDESK
jgi:hypothetical protein